MYVLKLKNKATKTFPYYVNKRSVGLVVNKAYKMLFETNLK